jgi:hypothetical protein
VFVLLPYPNYRLSAKIFSNEDLDKQIQAVTFALRYLHQTENMTSTTQEVMDCWNAWQGHETQLAEYGLVLVEEAESRRMSFSKEEFVFHQLAAESGGLLKPQWFGTPNLHTSHQSYLLRADPEYYRAFFEHIRDDIEPLWFD